MSALLSSRTLFVGLVRLAGTGLMMLTLALAARVLDSAEIGRLLLVLAVCQFTSVVLQLGHGQHALSLFAGFAARSDGDALHAHRRAMGRQIAWVALAAAPVIALLFHIVLTPGFAWLAAAAGVWCLVATVLLAQSGFDRAFGRVRQAAVIGGAGQAYSLLAVASGVVITGLAICLDWPLSAPVLLGTFILSGLASWGIASMAGPRRAPNSNATPTGLLRAARPYWIATVLPPLYTNADLVIMSLIADDTMLGGYAVASRLAVLATLPTLVLAQSLAPGIARALAEGDEPELRRQTGFAMGVSAAASLLLAGPLILAPGPVLGLAFGDGFTAAAPILAILAIGRLASGLCGPTGAFLMAAGEGRAISRSTALAALSAIAGSLVLGVYWGGTGVAVAFAAALIGQNLFQLFWTARRFGFWPHLAWRRSGAAGEPRP